MLHLQHLSYTHPNKSLLFENLNLKVNTHDKIALIGNNGSGKSILLKIIGKELEPSGGHVQMLSEPYYVPQIFGQYDHLSMGQALRIETKVQALRDILNGKLTEDNYEILNNDWSIEERSSDALDYWKLSPLTLTQKIGSLSGGQKTKVFLAGLSIHQPEFILLDEPSNHLDLESRELLYDFIQSTKSTLLVVSHDRKLLGLLDHVCELGRDGINVYGGNYNFYTEQKIIEKNALKQDLQSREKALRKAKEKQRETSERLQKLDSRGKGKQEKAGLSRIMMNTLRNNAENSTSKTKGAHIEKIEGISTELHELRAALPRIDSIKFYFDNSALHKGKILFEAEEINYNYKNQSLWNENLSFQIRSGERIILKGANGSGKTTLIKIVLGQLEPQNGSVYRAEYRSLYIDQDYTLINNKLNVYEQALLFNISSLQEHDIKIRLNRFLFTKDDWDKPCSALSGGEKLRLTLCCLTIHNQSPNIIILDEPTNNLDIQNIEILTAAINEYKGSLIVVSHDMYFLEQINTDRVIEL